MKGAPSSLEESVFMTTQSDQGRPGAVPDDCWIVVRGDSIQNWRADGFERASR
jgi:hypothetical protein